jgi:hypothetical protein
MDAHGVSAIVNSAKHDGPECIQPVSDDQMPRRGSCPCSNGGGRALSLLLISPSFHAIQRAAACCHRQQKWPHARTRTSHGYSCADSGVRMIREAARSRSSPETASLRLVIETSCVTYRPHAICKSLGKLYKGTGIHLQAFDFAVNLPADSWDKPFRTFPR